MRNCTVCRTLYEPSKRNIKRGYWNCRDCENAKRRLYVLRHKRKRTFSLLSSEKRRRQKMKSTELGRRKIMAPHVTSYRIKSGKLRREPCVICGNAKSQGHHPDYSKLDQVVWLCALCHTHLHMGIFCLIDLGAGSESPQTH
jgi:hypothetical protein